MKDRKKLEKWFFVSGTMILVIGWLVIAGISLNCAIYLNCNADAADWWRHFLTVVGIPVVIYQF